ncbi:MAG: class I SAM-dependent methyltransferase [Thermomicrobiales bacterium]
MADARVVLKPGREKPVRQRHPWIFSGAVARIEGRPEDGDAIDVVDGQGAFLARGLLNRKSQLVVRLFTWDESEHLTAGLVAVRVAAARDRRTPIVPPNTDAYRVVFSEADDLPGLIVDRYGDTLAVQCSTLGLQQRKDELLEILAEELKPTAIIERPDPETLAREGVEFSEEEAAIWGEAPGGTQIREYGLRFSVALQHGQKTGFYLDQRENRRRVAAYCRGARVLNCFAYTGAFAVHAAAAGAEQIVNIESSAEALRLARWHQALNGLERPRDEYVAGDVFQVLREYRNKGERFDVIILDPPKFAHSAEQVTRATRGYKDINLIALQLLNPGGVLATFSCSGLVSPDLFQKVIFGASVDAQRPAQIVERLTQGADHPVLLSFPESEYLKGLVCRVF